jgi:ABC-type sugar transport system substrate-binding protein
MSMARNIRLGLLASLAAVAVANAPAAAQQQRQPNILVIMGDDVGWFNIGASWHTYGGLRPARR